MLLDVDEYFPNQMYHHCACLYILRRVKRNKRAAMHFSALCISFSQGKLLQLWISLIGENFMQGSCLPRCVSLARWDALGLSVRKECD